MKNGKGLKVSGFVFLCCGLFTTAIAQKNDSLSSQIQKYSADFSYYVLKEPCGWKTNDSLSRSYNSFVAHVLDTYGYPGYSVVGEDASEKFFNLMTLPFLKSDIQKKGLELMKPQILSKQVKGENFGRITDMLSIKQTGKQVYGTMVNLSCADCKAEERKFVVMPLQEPEKVDEFRESIGLPPMKEYLEKLKSVFTVSATKNVTVQNPCK